VDGSSLIGDGGACPRRAAVIAEPHSSDRPSLALATAGRKTQIRPLTRPDPCSGPWFPRLPFGPRAKVRAPRASSLPGPLAIWCDEHPSWRCLTVCHYDWATIGDREGYQRGWRGSTDPSR